ncbi:MAG: chromosome segregation protein SMC [Negativicutes bacterium]
MKRLEAYGFKSFADRIEIEFDRGVTAVVGPNGSGKSNITDAVRWVLGEQNVRSLRGTKAEDIIFTGSASRRASGVAEVSLTFLNDGDMPVDFSEVVITRRLFRTGESEFYINKTRCRLKDIYALIADTGLGHDGLSVISQNKIDEILNSRPEERRLFFEETAGITKYRDRKRESVRKLEAAEQNLTRVADIRQEIQTQLAPLEKEAARTQQYQAWQEKLRQCRVTALYRRQEHSRLAEAAGAEKMRAGEDEERAAGTAVQSLETKKELLAKAVLDLETLLEEKSTAKNRLHDAMEAAESELRVLEERRQQSDANQRRLKEERTKLLAEGKTANEEREKLLSAEKERQEKAQAAAEKVEEERAKAAALGHQAREQKAVLQETLRQRDEAQRETLTKESELKLIEHDIEAGHVEVAQKGESVAALEKSLAADREELASLDQAAAENAKEEADLMAAQGAAEKRRQEIQASLRPRQQSIRTARQYIEQAEAKVGVLTQMQAVYEGFGRAVKAVLGTKEPWRRGICGAVAELLTIPAPYLTAIEVALGAAQQNIVAEDTETARQAIAYLKRTQAGRVTFLPLDGLVFGASPEAGAKKLPGVIGYGNEVVQVEEKYRGAIDFLLARTLVVDTMEHALRVAKAYHRRLRIVTLEGELLHPGGSITGGSLQNREAGFLNRGGEIEALKKSLAERKADLEKEEQLYEAASQELASGEKMLEGHKKRLEEVRVRAAEVRVSREKLADQVEEDALRLAAMKKLAKERADNFAKAQQMRGETIRALQALRQQVTERQKAVTAAEERLEDLEQDAEDFRKWLTKLEMQAATLAQEAGHSRQLVLLKEKEIARIEAAVTENQQAAEKLESGVHEGKEEAERLRRVLKEQEAAYACLEKAYQALHGERMEKVSAAQEEEAALRSARQHLGQMQEKLHQLAMEQSKLQFATEQCVTTLQEEFHLTPEEAAKEALGLSDKALQETTVRLSADIEALGTVNLNAVAEYERLKERHDFMAAQAKDLEEAKENLLRIIKEMDATMTKQFKEAFARIKEHFNAIFAALFGGGRAEVRLTDETRVLEAGVEIEVQLPEKKQQNLSVLSGGERALTVIALLFAFLRVRPAPFVVLDEIDAPLDEANIMRFGRFLRDFAAHTQFVIVTHRKGTMEAADTMYGVTLEDAGVSKIISVRLDALTDVEKG